jgi:hypothetical protein
MASILSKPTGCVIEEIDDVDGRTYRWKKPSGGVFRYFIATFLIFWLCGWAIGWVTAATQLIRGNARGGELFLAIWLGLWTIGGVFAFCMLYFLLRPPRPESVTLGFTTFRFDSGTATINYFFNPWYAMQRYNSQWPFPGIFQRRKRLEIPKGDLAQVVMERVGERQRLCFDYGADRIEIGESLREPEREWLAAVIEEWRAT